MKVRFVLALSVTGVRTSESTDPPSLAVRRFPGTDRHNHRTSAPSQRLSCVAHHHLDPGDDPVATRRINGQLPIRFKTGTPTETISALRLIRHGLIAGRDNCHLLLYLASLRLMSHDPRSKRTASATDHGVLPWTNLPSLTLARALPSAVSNPPYATDEQMRQPTLYPYILRLQEQTLQNLVSAAVNYCNIKESPILPRKIFLTRPFVVYRRQNPPTYPQPVGASCQLRPAKQS